MTSRTKAAYVPTSTAAAAGIPGIFRGITANRSPLVRRCAWIGAISIAVTGLASTLYRHGDSGFASRVLSMSSSSTTDRRALLGGGEGTVKLPTDGSTPTCAVIFMHGLGDTAAGWSGLFPVIPSCISILPTAAVMPVSLNGGMPMPCWYDLYGLDESSREDSAGIIAATRRIDAIIDALPASIPPERVVVAGFSQGGALALTVGLRSTKKLAGIASLSGYLPLRTDYDGKELKTKEIFIAHGDADNIVSPRLGQASAGILKGLGLQVETQIYKGMGHSANDKEIADLAAFLKRVLP